MKLLRQFFIILSICFLGEMIQRLFRMPIPGNVIGMILLFSCLYSGLIKLEMIREISDFLLSYMAFFFIPAGVGILASVNLLRGQWIVFLAVCIITTLIVMVVTGFTVQLLKRGKIRCKNG